MANPYAVKELECMTVRQFSCVQAGGALLSSVLKSHRVQDECSDTSLLQTEDDDENGNKCK